MADLIVSKRTIKQTLTEPLNNNGKKFIIPDYQRPYSWDLDKCETLWDDVESFYKENPDNNEEYFLGAFVSCTDEDKNIAIIDGQQRLTSMFLLLRAFYAKLEIEHKEMPSDKKIYGSMVQIAPCIWDVNNESQEVEDLKSVHILSKVATAKDNEVFCKILETGIAPEGSSSNYAINYKFFSKKIDEYAQKLPEFWRGLCLCYLNRVIVLPVECEDLDSALRIFDTLNDRGLPLSDSDIFKAQLYRNSDDKESFIRQWKELEETLNAVNLSLNDIFRYYTHYVRAYKGTREKEIGLRDFYKQYELLKNKDLMNDLFSLADFWQKLLNFDDDIFNEETNKLIQCLLCYPNEYWRHPITVFYFKHKEPGMEKDREKYRTIEKLIVPFLKNLLAYLFIRFLERPTVNTIKPPIFDLCVKIFNEEEYNLSWPVINFENKMAASSSMKLSKPMILLNTYLFDNKQKLLPSDFQIEHIFPQKWDNAYFTWTKEEADKYIDMYGNKIPFERKLNIKASNGFYSKKKEEYKKSEILEVKSLIKDSDWNQETITKRNKEMMERLETFFKNNLKGNKKIEKIVEYKGGETSIIINELSTADIITYQVVSNDIVKDFETLVDAVKSIDPGIFKFGNKIKANEKATEIIKTL